MKFLKWHTVVFKCPKCGQQTDYALQLRDGPHKGTAWDPVYWCARCNTPARVREPWLFGAVYGPLMAFVAALAYDALSKFAALPFWASIAFASVCCAIIGWPLSRYLSRHLVYWEQSASGPRISRTGRF